MIELVFWLLAGLLVLDVTLAVWNDRIREQRRRELERRAARTRHELRGRP